MVETSFQRRQIQLPGTRLPPISVSSGPSLSLSFLPISSDTSQAPTPSTSTSMGDPTSSGVTSSPTSTASFAWSSPFPTSVQLCSTAHITWSYSGPLELLQFSVVSNVSPHPLTSSSSAIASGVDATSQAWDWSPVNITLGQYTMRAVGDDVQAVSPPFSVEGSNTSCLTTTASASSGAGSTSVPGTSSSVSPISSSSALPVKAASSRSKAGAIAGGVIGGIVLLAAVVAAFVLFRMCRQTPTRSRRKGLEGNAPLGKWGGLSSRDSGMESGLQASGSTVVGALPRKHQRVTSEAASTNLSPISSSMAHGHQSSLTTLTGTEEEKASSGGKGGYEYIESVPPLSNRRRSSASTSIQGPFSPVTSIPESYPSTGSQGRTRSKSASQSHRALALARLDGGEPMPASPQSARSPGLSRRSMDMASAGIPSSPPYDTGFPHFPMNRTSSGGLNGPPRRAVRKPVPALDSTVSLPSPTSADTPTVPTGLSLSRTSTDTGASTRALNEGPAQAQHPVYRHESQSSTTLRAPAAAAAPSRSREDLEAAGLELPNLNPKSSFGDRPVHYLIPDLPPPPRN